MTDSASNLVAINYCDYLYDALKEHIDWFFSELLNGEKNGIQVLLETINNNHLEISVDDKWLIEMLSSIFKDNRFYQYDLKKIVVYFDKYLEEAQRLEDLKKIRKLIKEKDRKKYLI